MRVARASTLLVEIYDIDFFIPRSYYAIGEDFKEGMFGPPLQAPPLFPKMEEVRSASDMSQTIGSDVHGSVGAAWNAAGLPDLEAPDHSAEISDLSAREAL